MKKIKQFFINLGLRIKSNPWGFMWRSTLLILAVVFMAVMISSSFTRKTFLNPVSASAQSSNNVQCPDVEIPDKTPPSYTPPVTSTPDFVVPNPDTPHFDVPDPVQPDFVVPVPPPVTVLPNEPVSDTPDPLPPPTPTVPTPDVPTPTVPNTRPSYNSVSNFNFSFRSGSPVSSFPSSFGDRFELNLYGNLVYRLVLSSSSSPFSGSGIKNTFQDIKFVNYYKDSSNFRCFFFRNEVSPYHGFLLSLSASSYNVSRIYKINSVTNSNPNPGDGISVNSLYVVFPVHNFSSSSHSYDFSNWFFSSLLYSSTSIVNILDQTYNSGYINGYKPGYADGYNTAYLEGYNSGYDYGSRNSYDLGFSAGKKAVRQLYYDAGFRSGYGSGYTVGNNVAFDTAYKQAYNEAYSVGYQDAYSSAYNNAWQNGYSSGSVQSFNSGYLQAYNDTYQDAFCNGYELGYNSVPDQNEAYSAGYNAGKVAGRNEALTEGLKNPISFVLEPVVTFFDTKLFGVISIGSILSVAIFVAVAIIFLKMFAGG